MKATIDKAGRVVIPAGIRAQTGLRPATVLDIRVEGGEIRMRPDVPHARLTARHGRLVAQAGVPAKDLPSVDVAALVAEERDRWPT